MTSLWCGPLGPGDISWPKYVGLCLERGHGIIAKNNGAWQPEKKKNISFVLYAWRWMPTLVVQELQPTFYIYIYPSSHYFEMPSMRKTV